MCSSLEKTADPVLGICLELRPHELSPVHVSMAVDIILVHIIFRDTYW